MYTNVKKFAMVFVRKQNCQVQWCECKKGAAFTCKACPSLETVDTVSKFTLCETLEGFMRGFAPHPTRGSASGLRQRDIIPLETRFY